VAIATYSCIRIKNTRRPLRSRCKKPLGKNGLLCTSCYEESKNGKIPILMCDDVTRQFSIPFKNQVFVYIDLSNKNGKTQKKNISSKEIEVKTVLYNSLNIMGNDDLEDIYLDLNLSQKSLIKVVEIGNDRAYKEFMVNCIGSKLISEGR